MHIAVSAPIGALRSGLAAMLDYTHQGCVTEVDDLLDWLSSSADADVVVVALEDGFDTDLIVDLRATPSGGAIVALVRADDPLDELRALRAGAAAVETWDVDALTLGRIVDLVADRRTVVPRHLADQLARGGSDTLGGVSAEEQTWLGDMARGRTVAELARESGFSEREMYRRLGDLYQRLGARDKTHALLIAVKKGLIAVD